MNETSGGHYLTRRDLEIVIRRAAELEAEVGSAAPELSEADVFRIAQEVGLAEDSVRRALAEHRAGVAGGGLLADRGWLSRLCGPGLVTATRQIPQPAEEVQEAMESHFQANESLRPVRRTKSASLWEPDRGVVASIVRSVDIFGRGYQLAKKTRAVELKALPLSEESCLVALGVDLANERAGWFWGLGMAVGGLTAAAAIIFIVNFASAPSALALGAPVLLGVTITLARAGYKRAVAKMRLILDGLLDRLEHDEPLEPPRPSWRDLLK